MPRLLRTQGGTFAVVQTDYRLYVNGTEYAAVTDIEARTIRLSSHLRMIDRRQVIESARDQINSLSFQTAAAPSPAETPEPFWCWWAGCFRVAVQPWPWWE